MTIIQSVWRIVDRKLTCILIKSDLRGASLVAQMVKNLPARAGDLGLTPWLGRSSIAGNGYPLQYSCLENPMDRGAWQATSARLQRVRHD